MYQRLRAERPGSASRHRDIVALVVADVELAWTGDALMLFDQLLPMREPSRHAGDGEQDREDVVPVTSNTS